MFNLKLVTVGISLFVSQVIPSIAAGFPREESGIISGLFRKPGIQAQSIVLHRRQSTTTCDSGAYACSDGKGCCPTGSDCGVYSGTEGCCRTGYTCVANSSPCVLEGEAGCPGSTDTCCLNADVCLADSSGNTYCLMTSWGKFGNVTGVTFNDTTDGTISTTPRLNVSSGASLRIDIGVRCAIWLSACLLVMSLVGMY